EGGNSALHVAADHFIDECHQDAGAAGTDGMADRDCSAVHVDLVGIQSEFAHNTEGLNREGLVQLVEVDIFILPAGFLPNLANCADGAIMTHLGSTPLVACATMRTMGLAPSSFARCALVTTTAAAPSLTPGALPA